jgi:DNA-binding LytR/AlgR family response regulator
MKPLDAFIIDDEPDAGQLLQSLLHDFPDILVTAVFYDSLKALDAAVAELPPVIFLDIDMPEMTGMEFLKELNTFSPESKVVFVSAYRQYSLEALQNGAFDFIPKPLGKAELRRVVHKLVAASTQQNAKVLPENPKYVLLKTAEGHHHIATEKVLYLEAEGNYTRIYLTGDKSLFSGTNIGRLSVHFPQQQFIRISRKHIVNKNYLTFMNFNKKLCTISANGTEHKLEVSIKLKELKEQL